MTEGETAALYGVLVASAVAILLLVLDEPTGRNLAIAIAAGVVTAVASWLRLRR